MRHVVRTNSEYHCVSPQRRSHLNANWSRLTRAIRQSSSIFTLCLILVCEPLQATSGLGFVLHTLSEPEVMLKNRWVDKFDDYQLERITRLWERLISSMPIWVFTRKKKPPKSKRSKEKPLPQDQPSQTSSDSQATSASTNSVSEISNYRSTLPLPQKKRTVKYTVIFDLDETLIYNRRGFPQERSGARDLLSSLADNREIEVVLWTASTKSTALNALEHLNLRHFFHHIIARETTHRVDDVGSGSPKHVTWFGSFSLPNPKKLGLLGRPAEQMVFFDDNRDNIIENVANAVMVFPFDPDQYPSLKICDITCSSIARVMDSILCSMEGKNISMAEALQACRSLSNSPLRMHEHIHVARHSPLSNDQSTAMIKVNSSETEDGMD